MQLDFFPKNKGQLFQPGFNWKLPNSKSISHWKIFRFLPSHRIVIDRIFQKKSCYDWFISLMKFMNLRNCSCDFFHQCLNRELWACTEVSLWKTFLFLLASESWWSKCPKCSQCWFISTIKLISFPKYKTHSFHQGLSWRFYFCAGVFEWKTNWFLFSFW